MKSPLNQRPRIDIISLVKNAKWAFGFAAKENKSLMAGIVVLTLLRSCFPAAMALITRELINAVVFGIQNHGDNLHTILFWLALGFIFTALQSISTAANKYVNVRFSDELNLTVISEVIFHASSLDVATFEDPHFHDLFERVQGKTIESFSGLVINSLAIITNTLQICSLLVILIAIEPLLVLAIVVLVVPYFI